MTAKPIRRATVAVAFLIVAAWTPPLAAQDEPIVPVESTRAGPAIIVDASSLQPAAGGGSAAEFRLELPAGAVCPGDTANDGFQTSGFMIPEDESIADLVFGIINPLPEDNGRLFSLRDDDQPWMNENLPQNPEPGQPAVVVNLPVFTFTTFLPGQVPDGRYRIGMTCSFLGRPSGGYWDVLVDIETDSADAPAEFRWTVVEAPAEAQTISSGGDGIATTTWLVIAFAGAAVLFLAVSVVAGRGRETTLIKENST